MPIVVLYVNVLAASSVDLDAVVLRIRDVTDTQRYRRQYLVVGQNDHLQCRSPGALIPGKSRTAPTRCVKFC